MSTLTIFAMIFVFILILGGWITSEFISSKNTKLAKELRKHVAKLERENNVLQTHLTKETNKYTKLNEEYDKIKDSKQIIKNMEREYKALQNRYSNNLRGIEVIRKTVSSKKYLNNSLSKEINLLLSEHLPDEKQQEMKKTENSQQAFKRIKDGMGDGPV